MIENYLDILEESLQKKIAVLDRIAVYNSKQTEIFSSDDADLDNFDLYVEEKEGLIQELTRLDEGFETLYGNIRQELQGNSAKYAEQIARLQKLITVLTEKSVSVQAQEARNKELVEKYFRKAKEEIRTGRKTSKAAYDYYKNMNKAGYVSPQFMDSKK